MTGPRRDSDQATVRAAAVRTGLQVAGVSTGLVVAILLLAGLFIIDQSRPSELLERPRRGESKIYVDSHEVLIALIVLGVGAVIVVGFASWAISRRAVEPVLAALRVQRAFVADASHELRTPLAVLDTRLQVLQRRLERGEAWREAVDAARRDTAVMSALLTDLLLLAESSASEPQSASSDLSSAVRASVADLGVLAASRGIGIVTNGLRPARVPLSEPSLRRAVTILVDNALEHAPAGSQVRVVMQLASGAACVRVTDEGPGIPADLQQQVFQRFAHGPTTGRRRGFGLGLALVRDLVVRVGGAVQIESTSAAGTTMLLRLPVS